jgi:hypothetical protein
LQRTPPQVCVDDGYGRIHVGERAVYDRTQGLGIRFYDWLNREVHRFP